MKKALIVANYAGFASFLLSDIDILSQMGYEVTFAANGNVMGWEDTKENLALRRIKFVHVDFENKDPYARGSIVFQNYYAYKQIRKLLKEGSFDLVHCHTPIAGLITRLAASSFRKRGTKVIYTTHGFSFTSHSSLKTRLVYKTLEHFGSLLCDAIITINNEDFVSAQKMHCRNVYYIHGVGVDTAKYRNVEIDRNAYRQSIGVSENDIMVLSVGQLSARKNHKLVIEALAQLPDKDRYIYVICGGETKGGTGNDLASLAATCSVRLNMLGFRYDIPEITYCSDIGAIPSLREGLGLAGIQSLAAGIPVVGSNVQGIRDYIVDGDTGYLCGPNDSVAFSNCIERLAQHSKNEKERMKLHCYKKAQEFDKDVSRKEMEMIYQRLLGSAACNVLPSN